ncbi:MAG: bifunctional UDP-N-acetylmuramoyl-tripeptide:D-alanyl-D-alanine ligase/alanine racemase [Bacteroidota bacterium]|nr:bifunctional UDP-N-acetylmuramoyl-tripeptide:D-alanyl-D-alanine ligase/alanine racemase [Bacteroidota bacterium]
MLIYTIAEIAKIVKGKLIQNQPGNVKYLLTDSRLVASPSDTLFFALVSKRRNGHDFIQELYKKGVCNFVVSELPESFDKYPLANFVLVPDTLVALQQLCTFHRRKFHYPVVGITGSNGKTIVKEWIFQVLEGAKRMVRSPKSYNSQIGVPLSVWLLDTDYDLAVIEAGISQKGEMEKLHEIIVPEVGIFTNIGPAHQENFSSYDEKIDEKLKLFRNCKILIYCKDQQEIDKRIKADADLKNTRLFTWSQKEKADLSIKSINTGDTFTEIKAVFEGEVVDITIPFTDKGSIENAINVWAFALYFRLQNNFIREKMKVLAPVAMRLEMKHGINHCTIINDSYNSDLISLGIALDFLNQQRQHVKHTLILSDILQSGREERELYAEVSELLRMKKISRFIGIGKALSKNQDLFKMDKEFFEDTHEFLLHFANDHFKDEAILLKGSRSFEFERISHVLEQKAHRTALEINLNAMVHNLNYFRSKLKPETKMTVMVKAFSYGSGSYEIANMLQYQRVDYLAVAFADEGISLRDAGITVPILVMNPEVTSYDLMIDYKLEPQIYGFTAIKEFNEAVVRKGLDSFPIHVKLDTGMHRLGFMEEEIDKLIESLKLAKNVHVQSIFSHLAGADEEKHDEFTRSQIACFDRMSSKIMKAFDYTIIRHILNSAGIERFPEAQFDMVRLGIGIYGISAVDQTKVRNVSTLRSTISQIKTVPGGETVGYGRKGKTTRDTKIAIVPIGYADGLNRKLSNGVGKFLVNGKFAPLIGNICMDLCMIDITGIEAEEGDDVIVFGETYTITDVASLLGTIPYEILTGVSSRVKRVYYQE